LEIEKTVESGFPLMSCWKPL